MAPEDAASRISPNNGPEVILTLHKTSPQSAGTSSMYPRISDEDTHEIVNSECDGSPISDNSHKSESNSEGESRGEAKGGWTWVVLFSAFCVLCMNFGIQDSYGIFYPGMQDKFGVPRSTLSWIGSVGTGFGCFSAIVMPTVIDRLGCFVTGLIAITLICGGFIASMFVNNVYILYLTMGVMPALGETLQFLIFMKVISHCFHKRFPLAMGLAYSGGGMGTVMFPPLLTYLLNNYGLWGTLLLEGGIILNQFWCNLTFRSIENRKGRNSAQKDTKEPVSWRDNLKILKSKEMLLVLLSTLFYSMVYSYFPTYTPTASVQQIEDIDLQQASLIVSVYGVVSTIGRAVIGVFLTYLKNKALRVQILLLCGCAITIGTIPLCTSYAAYISVGAVYAFFVGSTVALQPTMLVEFFGHRLLTHAYGFFLVASGFASIVGIPFAGFFAEWTSHDSTIFYMAVVGFITSAICLVPLSFIGHHYTESDDDVKKNANDSEPQLADGVHCRKRSSPSQTDDLFNNIGLEPPTHDNVSKYNEVQTVENGSILKPQEAVLATNLNININNDSLPNISFSGNQNDHEMTKM